VVVPEPTGSADLPPGVVLPQEDRRILLAAVEAEADFFLTGNTGHFGRLLGRQVGSVRLMLPAAFLLLFEEVPW
jgi:hypothetical protein